MKFIDYIGLLGGILVLFAFYRTSVGKWSGKSLWYELDNLVGALCMAYYTYAKGAYMSILLNLVWAVVAFRGVTTLAERRIAAKKHVRTKKK